MKLAIVVLCWRNRAEAFALIEGLMRWQRLSPTVILVENEAESPSFGGVGGLVNLVSPENKGFGGGCNIGIQEAIRLGMHQVLLLNTDAEIQEQELEKLLSAMAADERVFSVGPKLEEGGDGKTKVYAGGKNIAWHINTRRTLEEIGDVTGIVDSDYTPGAIALFDLRKIGQVGLLDETYFFSGEVADWCYRAAKAGFGSKTVLGATGYHRAKETKLRRGMYIYYNFRNRFLFIRKHRLGWQPRAFWYKTILRELAFFLVKGNWIGARAVSLALFHILIHRYSNQNSYFVEPTYGHDRHT